MSFDNRITVSGGNGAVTGDELNAFMLNLTGLTIFTTMSSIDRGTGEVMDISGAGRHLTNTNTVQLGWENDLSYGVFDGTNAMLSRPDESAIDIIGNETFIEPSARGLTMGCIVKFDGGMSIRQYLIAKSQFTGPGAASYNINKQSSVSGKIQFLIANGGSVDFVNLDDTPVTDVWYPIIARWTPSTEIKLYWVFNGSIVTKINTSTILATLGNTALPLLLGRGDSTSTGQGLNGKMERFFLCASALDDSTITTMLELMIAYIGL
jgi:hypothetical protein